MSTERTDLQERLNPSLAEDGLELKGPVPPAFGEILTVDALRFLGKLAREFEGRRQALLQARKARQKELDDGKIPDFLEETKSIRESAWTVAPIPEDLRDRRVEITGPVDRKMVINALNSGASVFMADFEDANAPTWSNNIEGQVNLRDAVNGTITFQGPAKSYALNEETAILFVRPRGWHLDEKHLLVDGKPISGSLFDFGLFFFHNAKRQLEKGTGPYFYLPKLESHLEARLWNDVFNLAQDELGIRRGTIRATVLIETILAVFEMDEILYELRDHSAGLNCGRWDYIFSFIKKFRNRPDYLLPNRAQIGMGVHFLRSYVERLIRTCHKRGIHAMGGMAAQIPIKSDPEANEQAIEKVRQDKLREVKAGHDGTWVAHPGLVPIAREIFDTYMKSANQIDTEMEAVEVTPADLVRVPDGEITEEGLRMNIDVGVQYLESWLGGNGCVPIYHQMEDAATAEISRTQVWQWVRHGARLDDGRVVTPELVKTTLAKEMGKLRERLGPERFDAGRFDLASRLFEEMSTSDDFPEFMTLIAYDHID